MSIFRLLSKYGITSSRAALASAQTSADAREDLGKMQQDALGKTAKADFEVAMAKARGAEDVATEKCGALSGADKTACLSAAALAAAEHYQ